MSPPPAIDARLDVSLDLCPMTFVKTKIELEEMAPGQHLEVLVRAGEPLENVTRSCAEDGHAVVAREPHRDTVWRVVVRRGEHP